MRDSAASSPRDAVGLKSHFIIERWGVGWAVNVHRRGQPVQTTLVKTEAEANRMRQRLSGEGLIGYVNRGAG